MPDKYSRVRRFPVGCNTAPDPPQGRVEELSIQNAGCTDLPPLDDYALILRTVRKGLLPGRRILQEHELGVGNVRAYRVAV
ncbi:protein of unknown function [Bradyrhizobium vignae]|uniref:Uncharacterized protein n=1 Tax=Bradyrhizobium vignae TaxID=1549949 RepID=A0A2U3PR99_9BRAD|nr:protein of unknown function [Bradyrhizobium vignae]